MDPMMTFALCCSSMHTEVTEQWGHWESVVVITADAALWRRSLAAVNFWLRASLKLDKAFCIEALHTGLSIARSSNSLGLMWHHWRFAFTESLYLSLGRPWFRLPSWNSPYTRRLGIRNTSMRMTSPTHRSWALRSMDSMLVELARSSTSKVVTRSCQRISSTDQRARMWKCSNFFTFLRYSVHVSQP